MNVLYGHTEFVTAWVKARVGATAGDSFGPSTALGVMDKSRLIAGVVFHDWQPAFRTIQASCAADDPRWAMRGILSEILSYPFYQIGVNRINTIAAADNTRAREFNKRLGMTEECVAVEWLGDRDAVFYRLLKREWEVGRFCKKERENGTVQKAQSASRA